MKLKTFLKLVLFLAPFAALGQTKLSPQAFSQPIDSVYNFENVSLFVAGETHYRPANFTLQFELFKKLHEKGFDIILYENCYSKCFFMNEYIKGEKQYENMEFDPTMLTAIYLGSRMGVEETELFLSLITPKYQHVKIFKAHQSQTEYKIEMKPFEQN